MRQGRPPGRGCDFSWSVMGGRNGNVMVTELKERYIHFQGLGRRQLQRLCKKRGIPANKSSAFLVEALSKLLLQNGSTLFPGLCRSKTPQNPLVLQPAASASVIACKSDVGFERVIAYKDSQHIDKKLRVKQENGESERWVLCKAEPSQFRGTVAGRNSQGTHDMPKIKEELEEEFGPTNAEGWGLLDDTCNEDDDPFDDRFARLEGFTPSMEALFSLEDDDTDVNQEIHQDTDGAERMMAIQVDACGKKPCSPGETDVYAPFLEKVVIVKENTVKEEVAVGEKWAPTAIETRELGATKESCVSENGDTETSEVINTAKGPYLQQIPGENSCKPVLRLGTPGEQSKLSGTGLVDPPGKLGSPELSFSRGVKRSSSVVEESWQVCFEPPRAVSNSSVPPVCESQDFEFLVQRAGGISLTVDLMGEKCSPGPAMLQYVEAVSPGLKTPVSMPLSVRVTRISSILDLARGQASKGPCRRAGTGLVTSVGDQ